MTNNIKLSARKTSFILAVSCILFSVIATYLYINHQIDLTRYTTPIILGTVVIIITCGGLQRVFYIFLTDECPQLFSDNQRNSIPDKVIPKPDMIIEECSEPTVEVSDIEMIEVSNATEVISMIELPEKTKNTDTTENKAVSSEIVTSITISEQHDDSKEIKVLEQQPTSEVKPEAFSYLQGFESRMEEIQKEELERKIMIINAIHEYVTYSTAKFLTKENLLILHENIDHLASGQSDLYKPIRSKMETKNLTFNDLPTVVGELCKRIESLETVLKNSLAVQNKVKENHHVPMTVDEVCTYLGISKSSFYYKVKHGGIPVIKQGKHLFVYRDELDKWLETGRKVQVPLTFEEEQTQMLAAIRRKANPKNV